VNSNIIHKIMFSIKNKIYNLKALPLALLAGLLFSSCTIDSVDSTTDEISDADLEAAGQIIGESLSDQNDGILTSLNDAIAIPSDGGFDGVASSALAKPATSSANDDDEDNSGRGSERNFSYSFDPETGTHTLSFDRSVNRPNFSKSSSATLEYIFLDINGEFIVLPRAQRDRIETIDFSGIRNGSLETPRKKSSFEREDEFLIDGLTDGSPFLSIDGVHRGSGNFEASGSDGQLLERNYTILVDFLNVQIDKSLAELGGDLSKGVTGTLTYEININRTRNGDTETKTIQGTVEFTGDGTALLRFADFSKIFRIKLDDGKVFDDDEFEGIVRSVDLDESFFTLANGQRVKVTDATEIEGDGDLFSLQEVDRAIQNGFIVEAEGEVERREGSDFLFATEVEFELDADADFEGIVQSVNLVESSFTLENGRVFLVTEESEIEDDGDFFSLEEVDLAIQNGQIVEADGEFFRQRDTDENIVLEVEFESDDDDGDDEDDDNSDDGDDDSDDDDDDDDE